MIPARRCMLGRHITSAAVRAVSMDRNVVVENKANDSAAHKAYTLSCKTGQICNLFSCALIAL